MRFKASPSVFLVSSPVTLAFLIVGVPCIVIGVIVCSVAAYRYCVKYDLPGRIRGRSAEDEADDNSADGEIQQVGYPLCENVLKIKYNRTAWRKGEEGPGDGWEWWLNWAILQR